jgi:hypothetical protein
MYREVCELRFLALKAQNDIWELASITRDLSTRHQLVKHQCIRTVVRQSFQLKVFLFEQLKDRSSACVISYLPSLHNLSLTSGGLTVF